jgi:hypothetical protein
VGLAPYKVSYYIFIALNRHKNASRNKINNMNEKDFKALHEYYSKKACSMLIKKGNFKHTAILGKGKELHMVTLTDKENGSDIENIIRPMSESIGAEYIFIISEAWAAPPDKIEPSKHAEKCEILIVTAEHMTHGHYINHYEIIRKSNGKISKLKIAYENHDQVKGRLTHILTGVNGNSKFPDTKKQPGYKSHFKNTGYTLH